MIIKKIENNHFIIKNINIKKTYNSAYLEKLIKDIIHKLSKNNKLYKLFIFIIYLDKYNNTIIEIFNKKTYNKNIDIKIKFILNNTLLYKIDYFLIKKIHYKKEIYYYDNNYYINIKNIIKEKDKIFLEENSNILYGKESLEILNKGIKLRR